MEDKYKIAFISPKSSFYFKNDEFNELLLSLPGFNLHTNYWGGMGTALPILASLTPDNFEIQIIDENKEEIDFTQKYDLVAVTSMTHQAVRAYQITDTFKKNGVYTVLGGIHPTMVTDEAMIHSNTVIKGEGENCWKNFIIDFCNDKPKSLYISTDYEPVNLKDLPIPRYDLLKNKDYTIVWMNTERGCPYDCEFCSVTNLFGKKNRHKSIEQIINELIFIKNNFKRIFIGFSDNNMFINRKFSKELLLEMKKLNIRWVGQSDISIGRDPELLSMLFDAGCHVLFIGFESLNEKNLDEIYQSSHKLKKDFLSDYSEMIEQIQSHGIGILGSFIVGLDYDTPDTFDLITDFVDKTNMLTATINVLTPLPGTRLRERMLNEDRVLDTSWDNYTFWDVNFVHKYLTIKQIEEGMLYAFKKIYSEKRMKKTAAYFNNIFKKINK